jgi:hypothetical protein
MDCVLGKSGFKVPRMEVIQLVKNRFKRPDNESSGFITFREFIEKLTRFQIHPAM